MTTQIKTTALMLTVLMLTSCGGKEQTSPDASISLSSFVGDWNGTTSQGSPISLTVSEEGVEILCLEWVVVDESSGTTEATLGTPIAVDEEGKFYISTNGGGGRYDILLNGTFSSETSLSGTIQIGHHPDPPLEDFVFSATKGGDSKCGS